MQSVYTVEWCLAMFPPERTGEFFEALFGDPDDGAYDIALAFVQQDGEMLEFCFNLHRRGNQCLACNLTHGLPKVFERHPIINCDGLAQAAAAASGRTLKEWKTGHTREESKALHKVPFYVWLE